MTMRDQTEWVELVSSGCNSLVGADKELILKTYEEVSSKIFSFADALYGDGNAAALIVEGLRHL